ncbi:metallophosphoesterase [Negadavirga shengliensis]|uniref:Metallophosphoesterase n=1 Tax=Negadavirga shengliensis TaxID=1389218 RepID=A0ABV9T5J6_9BACT
MISVMGKKRMFFLGFVLLLHTYMEVLMAQEIAGPSQVAEEFLPYLPSKLPDRIILNLDENPLEKIGVNWRTSARVSEGQVQWALATHNTSFMENVRTKDAVSEFLSVEHDENPTVEAYYHAATLDGLEAGQRYVYRVGSGEYWSEWYQFETPDPASKGVKVLYLGDAQNGIRDHWSRLIRQAHKSDSNIDFILHAGDLINRHNNDFEWGEWFYAGDHIHATVPSVMTPGNHEYGRDGQLSPQWRPQFNLPMNGPEGLEETCYQVNFPDLKVISLNAEQIEESPYLKQKQKEWLDSLLQHDPRKWTIVTIHHPFYSTKENRDNDDLRKHFKPIIDKYKVDMVLQGHDHAYGRGMIGPGQDGPMKEVVSEDEGTVYVVSMAGIKMYDAGDYPWMERKASQTQTYQLIEINDTTLKYKAYTVNGILYDAFELHKQEDGGNRLLNQIPDLPEF